MYVRVSASSFIHFSPSFHDDRHRSEKLFFSSLIPVSWLFGLFSENDRHSGERKKKKTDQGKGKPSIIELLQR